MSSETISAIFKSPITGLLYFYVSFLLYRKSWRSLKTRVFTGHGETYRRDSLSIEEVRSFRILVLMCLLLAGMFLVGALVTIGLDKPLWWIFLVPLFVGLFWS